VTKREPYVGPGETLTHVTPVMVDGKAPLVVVLERIVPLGVKPDYCIHGRIQCWNCDQWCWLGHETVKAVQRGVVGVCRECAVTLIPKGSKPINHIEDHRRADGPH
jgi:hypothetical protein